MIGAPFGTELIAVIATPIPLDLRDRPRIEEATDYPRELRQALDRIKASSRTLGLVAILLVETSGR